MNKTVIMPQVVVYQNIFSQETLDYFLKTIKDSENSLENFKITRPEESAYRDFHGDQPFIIDDSHLIMHWTPWYTFGARSKIADIGMPREKNPEQYDLSEMASKAFKDVYEDYISMYKNSDWPEFVDWEEKDPLILCDSEIEILKHHMYPGKEYAIEFHTDRHEHRIDTPGGKQIITFTFYLNDNYEGGEVEFIYEEHNKVITYKPKAGDITVFPAGLPFWHSARAVTSGENKVFLRKFKNWEYVGSESYHEGVKKYGKKQYDNMVKEEAIRVVNSDVVGRQVIRLGHKPKLTGTKGILVRDENFIYINGKDISYD